MPVGNKDQDLLFNLEIDAMKKSLLALAVLGAFAGAASAQSSVTIYGKIDQSIGKKIGTANKEVMDNAGSRLAFRGYEDLGGGLAAVFTFEHRFFPDTGTVASNGVVSGATSTQAFWNGYSYVGLRHKDIGTVTLGRQYTAAFLNVQTASIDPFEGEGVAALREIGSGALYGVARVRVDNAIKYANTFGPITVAADLAETSTPAAVGAKKPYSVAVSGVFGPAWVGIAYENPEAVDNDVLNLAARVTFGPATISGEYSTGKISAATDISGLLLGAKVAVGSGNIKVGYATRKSETGSVKVTAAQRFGLGYDHNLSKRTKVYVQYARDSKVATEKAGYEVGMQHNF